MIVDDVLKSRLDKGSLKKLLALDNANLNELIADAILRFQPASVFVSTGSVEDLHHVRVQALRRGEEMPFNLPGHTIHYDGYEDQGRDPKNTRFLVSGNISLGHGLKSMERQDGLRVINEVMNSLMV